MVRERRNKNLNSITITEKLGNKLIAPGHIDQELQFEKHLFAVEKQVEEFQVIYIQLERGVSCLLLFRAIDHYFVFLLGNLPPKQHQELLLQRESPHFLGAFAHHLAQVFEVIFVEALHPAPHHLTSVSEQLNFPHNVVVFALEAFVLEHFALLPDQNLQRVEFVLVLLLVQSGAEDDIGESHVFPLGLLLLVDLDVFLHFLDFLLEILEMVSLLGLNPLSPLLLVLVSEALNVLLLQLEELIVQVALDGLGGRGGTQGVFARILVIVELDFVVQVDIVHLLLLHVELETELLVLFFELQNLGLFVYDALVGFLVLQNHFLGLFSEEVFVLVGHLVLVSLRRSTCFFFRFFSDPARKDCALSSNPSALFSAPSAESSSSPPLSGVLGCSSCSCPISAYLGSLFPSGST